MITKLKIKFSGSHINTNLDQTEIIIWIGRENEGVAEMCSVCIWGDKNEKLGVQPSYMKSTDEAKSELPRSNSMNI